MGNAHGSNHYDHPTLKGLNQSDLSGSAILAIKEAYWQRREYRDTITSDLIYRAVLYKGVSNVSEFENFLSNNST